MTGPEAEPKDVCATTRVDHAVACVVGAVVVELADEVVLVGAVEGVVVEELVDAGEVGLLVVLVAEQLVSASARATDPAIATANRRIRARPTISRTPGWSLRLQAAGLAW
ncbi:MAG: hypothetical protein ACLPQS_08575 [Acidimicrobiales bacterium]